MEIFWHGKSSFTILSSKIEVLFDPEDEASKKNGGEGEMIIIKTDPASGVQKESGASSKKEKIRIIDRPGEYEISGLMMQGIPAEGKGGLSDQISMFTLRVEGIAVAHLSRLKQKSLTENQLSELNGVDILLVPVGGKDVMTGKEASEIVSEIDPRVVIPMYFSSKEDLPGFSDVNEFLKTEGIKETEVKPSLKIEKKKLPVEEREVVLLEVK